VRPVVRLSQPPPHRQSSISSYGSCRTGNGGDATIPGRTTRLSETVAKSPFDDDLDRIAEAIDDEIACEVCAPNGAPLNETRIINGEERRLVRRRTDSEIYLGEMWAVGHGSRFDVRDPYNGVADILEAEAAKLLAVAGRVRAAAKAK